VYTAAVSLPLAYFIWSLSVISRSIQREKEKYELVFTFQYSFYLCEMEEDVDKAFEHIIMSEERYVLRTGYGTVKT